jgi:peptide/nickel transport system permease protein
VRLIARRAAAMVVVGFGITIVAFILTHLVPGDPVAANLGLKALGDPKLVQAYRAAYGLDKPLAVQYEVYLSHLFHGDLGMSQITHRPVSVDLRQFVPASLELALLAMVIALLIGVSLGLLAASNQNSWLDQVLSLLSQFGISTPTFWLGLIVIYLFTFVVQLAPGSGRLSPCAIASPLVTGMYTVDSLLAGDLATFGDALHHLILPAVVLAVPGVGVLLRFTRSAVLEVMHNDYVTAARAKGLRSIHVLFRYILRAAMTPILTRSGLMLADLLTGAVLVESVFAFPGVGLYAARSAINTDVGAITGVCIFVAFVYIVTNFAVDVLHSMIDPRVRLA